MITVKVDNQNAIARFGPQGIPVAVRNNLRRVIPDLTRRLGAKVDENLDTGLKSRRRLVVQKQMVENPQGVYGRVTTISTSAPFMLPLWLEDGTKAHEIVAKNAPALAFFWPRVGQNVFFKRVMHPGFAGIHYTANAFAEMESEIKHGINRAVRDGLGAR